jgi:hypothetical protein
MQTEGQKAFRRIAFNVLSGRCTCGRFKNKQGNHCCRMCREGYGTHSRLCQKNNPR